MVAVSLASVTHAVNLFGTSWQLAGINQAIVNPKMAAISLRIDGERFSGNTGCNRYFGRIISKITAILQNLAKLVPPN